MRNSLVISLALVLGACQTYGENREGEYLPRSQIFSGSAYQPGTAVFASNREAIMRPDGFFYRVDTGIIDSSATCEHYGSSSQTCFDARALRVSGAAYSGKEKAKVGVNNMKRWFEYCRPRGVCWDDAKRRAGDWWSRR